jgi:hypothetical protein
MNGESTLAAGAMKAGLLAAVNCQQLAAVSSSCCMPLHAWLLLSCQHICLAPAAHMLCPFCCAHSVSDCRPAADLHGRQVAGFAHLLLRAAWCVWLVQTPTSKGLVAN